MIAVYNVKIFERLKQKFTYLKIEIYAPYLAHRDPRVPWYAKAFVAIVVGYAFSPKDLVPDFIPVLGYVDDLVLIPLGVVVALKMIPEKVMEDCRQKAQEIMQQSRPVNRMAAVVIIAIWLFLAALVILFLARLVKK